MFNEEFYPTPPEVIKIMLEPYKKSVHVGGINGYEKETECGDLIDKTILDPSAGKGDILRYIQKSVNDGYYRNETEFYGIELNPDLQSILRENEISVLASDFLKYENDMFFDLIIMNPPFSNGDEHLLKAIEISRNNDIVCLLNAETILNPHTNRRKVLLEKINQYGSYEILGKVFSTAERKTDVNVALVRLKIEAEEQQFDFSFKDYEPQKIEFDESFIKNEIARQDMIGNMMIQFKEAKKAYKEFIEAEAKFKHYNSFLMSEYKDTKDVTKTDGSPQQRYNYYNRSVKKIMWKKVISELNLERYMTKSVRDNFNSFIWQQSEMSFTKENVHDLFNLLITNSSNILEQAITDVFDELTKHYYSENRKFVEGWKTNDRFKINRKIIAPTYVRYGEYMSTHDIKIYGDTFSLSWQANDIYTDIDKVMAYISGNKYEQIKTIGNALEWHFRLLGKVRTGQKYNNECESTFFKIKFYKKGTVHLYFKDKWLWEEFNMRACADKNWLPDDERTKWEEEKAQRRRERQNDRNGVLRVNQENTDEVRSIQQLEMFS